MPYVNQQHSIIQFIHIYIYIYACELSVPLKTKNNYDMFITCILNKTEKFSSKHDKI